MPRLFSCNLFPSKTPVVSFHSYRFHHKEHCHLHHSLVLLESLTYQPFQSHRVRVTQRYQVNMLSLNLLFTSLLVGFAAAQNTTFNSGSVDLTTKSMSLPAVPSDNET